MAYRFFDFAFHFMKSAFDLVFVLVLIGFLLIVENCLIKERDFRYPPREQQIVRRTGHKGWAFANGPAQASSRFETGNDGDGLCRPCSVGFGR